MEVKKLYSGITGTIISACSIGISTTELESWISIITAVGGFLITFVGVVLIPLIQRIKKAKADGKITADEANEIIEKTKEDLEKIKEKKDE